MIGIKNLSKAQRRVFDACHNGWFVGGQYRAFIDGQEGNFWADSPRLLFRDVDQWISDHDKDPAASHLLVKCVKAA